MARLLSPFDPWKGMLCTCPQKLSLNPYTGCSHGCLYCYASSYIPRFHDCRPKVDLIRRLKKEIAKAKTEGQLVSMANSSDPYPPIEADLRLTRGCLQLFRDNDIKTAVVTKSDMVVRDLDVIASMKCCIAVTITTLDQKIASKLEPNAPSPHRRLEAIRRITEMNVSAIVRIDPIIPLINDSGLEELVDEAAQAGARHIITSTYKARPDSLNRICAEFPSETAELRLLYQSGKSGGNCSYLPSDQRERILAVVVGAAKKQGICASFCREGLHKTNCGTGPAEESRCGKSQTICCDGTYLIQ
jgi:DNA repair photolyase